VDAYVRASVLELVRAFIGTADRVHVPLGRSWPTGSMVLWVAVLLAAYLFFYL
jgi:hypothetical protein